MNIRSLNVRSSLLVGVFFLALVLGTLLVVRQASKSHPYLTRQAAIGIALQGRPASEFPNLAAKLVQRKNLKEEDPYFEPGSPNDYFWVVAASGNLGVGPSYGCCGVGPPPYDPKKGWSVAIIQDTLDSDRRTVFQTSLTGSWPPFFDAFPDLAAGSG